MFQFAENFRISYVAASNYRKKEDDFKFIPASLYFNKIFVGCMASNLQQLLLIPLNLCCVIFRVTMKREENKSSSKGAAKTNFTSQLTDRLKGFRA